MFASIGKKSRNAQIKSRTAAMKTRILIQNTHHCALFGYHIGSGAYRPGPPKRVQGAASVHQAEER